MTPWTTDQYMAALRIASDLYARELGRRLFPLEPTTDLGGLCSVVSLMHEEGYDEPRLTEWIRASDEYRNKSLPPEPSSSRLIGPLRIEGGAYCDETGPRLPILCHAGDLLALYARDPSWAKAELDEIAEAGYLGVRTWTWLDGEYWQSLGRSVSPAEFGWSLYRDFALALKARGLRWLVSQGDMLVFAPDRWAFMRQLAETLREAGGLEVVCGVDSGNEAWNNGEGDPARLRQAADAFRSVLDVPIWSLSSPPGEETADLDRYSGSVYDVHGYRGGHLADKLRHAFSIAYDGRLSRRLGIQSEPPGPGPMVSIMEHPEEMDAEAMTLLTAMHLMSRQISVVFSSPGVSVRERSEFARQPGFREAAAVASILPSDLMRFGTLCHGGESQRGRRVLCATGEGQSLARVDQAIADDGRFVAIAYAQRPGTYAIPIERPCEAQVFHPVTHEAVETIQPGQGTLSLSFERGRIIVGRLV